MSIEIRSFGTVRPARWCPSLETRTIENHELNPFDTFFAKHMAKHMANKAILPGHATRWEEYQPSMNLLGLYLLYQPELTETLNYDIIKILKTVYIRFSGKPFLQATSRIPLTHQELNIYLLLLKDIARIKSSSLKFFQAHCILAVIA